MCGYEECIKDQITNKAKICIAFGIANFVRSLIPHGSLYPGRLHLYMVTK